MVCINTTSYKEEEKKLLGLGGMSISTANYSHSLSATAAETADETIQAKPFVLNLFKNLVGYIILPGSVSFTWSGVRYIDRQGKLYRNVNPATGYGVEAGTIDYSTGVCTLTVYDGGDNTLVIHSMACRIGRQLLTSATFRTPGAPIRPASISITGVALDGSTVSGISAFDGTISGQNIDGVVDYDKGIVWLKFGEWVTDDGSYYEETWYNPDEIVGGQIFRPTPVFGDSLSYTCVVYSYIPLDADLLGLDPVRLPTDGRVPIVRVGDVVVIHNTQTSQLPNPLSAGQVLTMPRANVAHVELYDSSATPLRLPFTKYSWSEETQQLTMADPLDLSGYTQPIIAMHRVEDMVLVSGVQINGQIIVSPALQNNYAIEGTYVSSALKYGDLKARLYNLFDQATWTSVWSNSLIGSGCNASYNELNYQPIITNRGAINGRWCLKLIDATSFQIIEEKLGILGTGYTTQDCAPINPATGTPYFFLDYRGWGTGWAAGNVLRFNTDGAVRPLWLARTTLQGPVSEPNDQFTIQIRGDGK